MTCPARRAFTTRSPANSASAASWKVTPTSPGASPGGGAGIAVTKPFDGKPASFGNGVMVALDARDPAQVDRIHAIALANGGSDEGAPGVRGGGFYAAYFRDPDGNKLNAFCMPGPDGE